MNLIQRSGVDLIEIDRLQTLAEPIRQRFLHRVFTDLEIEQNSHSTASLAGRFAAKEAVAKALGCGIGPVGWQEIEILRGEAGEPVLQLHGSALACSQALHLETWSISISHDRTHAVAIAVALGCLPSSLSPS